MREETFTYPAARQEGYVQVPFDVKIEETVLTREFSENPFVPANAEERVMRCEEILHIQALGLKNAWSICIVREPWWGFRRAGFHIGASCHSQNL